MIELPVRTPSIQLTIQIAKSKFSLQVVNTFYNTSDRRIPEFEPEAQNVSIKVSI